jgi:alanine dehydrogenase
MLAVKPQGTLLLTAQDVASLLDFEECMKTVEEAFRLYAEGRAAKPGLLHVDSMDGEFHIKAGALELRKRYFALKVNGGFFRNVEHYGMPNIQGLIVLCDGENGYPLAVMDSKEITRKRTGAATAVAAKYLARAESKTVTICGCGAQGRIQLRALTCVLPIEKVFAVSRDQMKALEFARQMSQQLGLHVETTQDLQSALQSSDVCVTCTPSRKPIVFARDIRKGTFLAAVGADSPEKQELEPELVQRSKVVVDLLEQCAHVGELHHALEKGMQIDGVHAELGEIILGRKPGRVSKEEIIIFDSTGTALQDVASAAAVFEKALASGKGRPFNFYL